MTTPEFGERDLKSILEPAFLPGGFIEEAARAAIGQQVALTPGEVADVITPPRQEAEAYRARWQLAEDAKGIIKAVAREREQEVMALAERLGMRHDESLTDVDIARIQPQAAIWLVEGGANRTSVVRRNLAIEAMRRIYGESDLPEHHLYQFGGDRPIPRERNGESNSEYAVAEEIAGDFLPEDGLTEFELNLASARQSGYEIAGLSGSRVIKLKKERCPSLILVRPRKVSGGLSDAFSELANRPQGLEAIIRPDEEGLSGKQFVIATNGQYRPKDELQAEQFAERRSVDMLPAVAIGDEPGYRVEHGGREIVTGNRAPMAYLNEMVVLKRLIDSEAQ